MEGRRGFGNDSVCSIRTPQWYYRVSVDTLFFRLYNQQCRSESGMFGPAQARVGRGYPRDFPKQRKYTT